jgi:hypothetical protein
MSTETGTGTCFRALLISFKARRLTEHALKSMSCSQFRHNHTEKDLKKLARLEQFWKGHETQGARRKSERQKSFVAFLRTQKRSISLFCGLLWVFFWVLCAHWVVLLCGPRHCSLWAFLWGGLAQGAPSPCCTCRVERNTPLCAITFLRPQKERKKSAQNDPRISVRD